MFFDVTSKKDVKDGFLLDEKLSVTSIEIMEGDANIDENNVVYIPPLSHSMFKMICIGEYGGVGQGVKHPPSSIKIKVYTSDK